MTEDKALTTAQLINQDSGKTEYYTPVYILEAAEKVMGSHINDLGQKFRFELDPASSDQANQYVHAMRLFDEGLNGLNHSWNAKTVWLNHPYSRATNRDWINKAVNEYNRGNVGQLCTITWASTSEKWFHPLFNFPICFFGHRIKFIDPNRTLTGATKSSCLTYMGPNVDKFIRVFGLIGHVMIPHKMPAIARKHPPLNVVEERGKDGSELLIHDYI